jgi:hypothetical protein
LRAAFRDGERHCLNIYLKSVKGAVRASKLIAFLKNLDHQRISTDLGSTLSKLAQAICLGTMAKRYW